MTGPSPTLPAKSKRRREAVRDAASADSAATRPGGAEDAPHGGPAQDDRPRPLSARRRARWALSGLIVAHLLAVFLPPLAFQTRGPWGGSPSVTTLLTPLEGYGQFLYLDRGYAFFAPDPGPSHLVQVGVRDDSGEFDEHMFPDLDRQWPRLLYHRHFMLSEFLHELHQPPGPPEELAEADPEQAEAWAQARARFLSVHDSIVEHLEHKHPGKQVAIRRIEHAIPNFVDYVADPIPLDDPRLYNILLDRPRPPEARLPESSPLEPVPPGESPSGIPQAGTPQPGTPQPGTPRLGTPQATALRDEAVSP